MASTSSENKEELKKCDIEKITELSWANCPTDVLLMIFKKLPIQCIAVCMFVCIKWNKACEELLNWNGRWLELIEIHIPHEGIQFITKSNGLSLHKIYRNGLLWLYLEKSTFSPYLEPIRDPTVKKLNVYNDNLIVINPDGVQYYGIHDHKLRREFSTTCMDYIENDYMIAHISFNGINHLMIRLYGKATINDVIDMTDANHIVQDVKFCRVYRNVCYIVGECGVFWTYTYEPRHGWVEAMLARYYGNMLYMYGLTVCKGEVFLWLNTGEVMTVNYASRQFEHVTNIQMPRLPHRRYLGDWMFHMMGFAFKVAETEPFTFLRYALDKHMVYAYESPKLATFVEHGDVVFFGNTDGTVDMYRPRDYSTKSVVKTIRLQDYVPELCADDADTNIKNIQVYEDDDCHHLFVSTSVGIFHFKITYDDPDSFMWGRFPTVSPMELLHHTQGRKYVF